MIIIDAGYFYAGVVLDEKGNVKKAAPIVGYMLGWDKARVLAYAKKKGWDVHGKEVSELAKGIHGVDP